VSLGFVTGLDYRDPRLDPQHVLQAFKQHPFISKVLAGGKMIRYGAKSLPYGGWWSLPPLGGEGWMIVGDSAGFLNSARLKGIHLAIKSGMLAAETAFEALVKSDSSSVTSSEILGKFQRRVETSWIHDELWPVRNFHQGFKNGMYAGMFNTVLQDIFPGGMRGTKTWNRSPSCPPTEARKHTCSAPRRAMASSPSTNSPTSIIPAPSMKRISRRIC
jgi:electron-transferring-flavoprotein dehydrogenase